MSEQEGKTAVYRDNVDWKHFLCNGLIVFAIQIVLAVSLRYFNISLYLTSLAATIALPPFVFASWRNEQKRDDAIANTDGLTLFLIVVWLVFVVITVASWPR